MKIFTPGTIARAADVNENFEELKTAIDELKNSRAFYEAAGLIADSSTGVLAGQAPPVGTLLKRRTYARTVTVAGGGGGISCSFSGFKGITGVNYQVLERNIVATTWAVGPGGVWLTLRWFGGGVVGDGTKVKATFEVVGW